MICLLNQLFTWNIFYWWIYFFLNLFHLTIFLLNSCRLPEAVPHPREQTIVDTCRNDRITELTPHNQDLGMGSGKESCRLRVYGVYVYKYRWCVRWRGGTGGETFHVRGGSDKGRGIRRVVCHPLYSVFTRRGRSIKMYKETRLSIPKTQNWNPAANSTWHLQQHLFFFFFFFLSTIENKLFL